MTVYDWAVWLAAITRPYRWDDEEVPDELGLAPWWAWRWELARRYGVDVGDVEVMPRPASALRADAVIRSWEAKAPALTDSCRDGRGVCHCRRRA